ncbi:hypothetical protein TUM18780_27810 [Escherichia coli]|uniref:Restriction endonuclease subunit S n=1 Tax=Escherichia coli TaxID=562 RepID=A0ABC8E1W2_ECOLX|nr:hypothetical protein TUM18530_27850 [Escherichia coli]BCG37619.1 hypothetical protein TUM18780_27810 [Escherichia coli]BEG26232.1 hypothetical protein VEF10_27950 [Escherichia coli]
MARDSLYPVSVKAGKPILGMLPTGWQKLSLEKCLNIECHERCNSDPHPTPEIRSRG